MNDIFPPEFHAQWQEFLTLLSNNEPEETLINFLEDICNEFGVTSLKNYPYTEVENVEPSLAAALQNDYKILAQQLILLEADINEPLRFSTDSRLRTPLMLASLDGHEDLVESLLKCGAELLATDAAGCNALIYASSPAICEMLLANAQLRNQAYELITAEASFRTCFEYFIRVGKIDNVRFLLTQKKLYQDAFTNKNQILSAAREQYFKLPEQAVVYDQLCSELKEQLQFKEPIKPYQVVDGKIKTQLELISVEDAYYELFHETCWRDENPPQTKEDAVKLAIAEIFSLFRNPNQCIKYIDELGKMFFDYYKSTQNKIFSTIDPETYTFQYIESYCYPIPTDKYQPISKHKDVAVFFMAFLQQFGIADTAKEWVGFVPQEIANQQIKDADYIKESVYGLSLLHTQGHVLQYALIAYHFFYQHQEQKLLYGQYREYKLGLRDILEGLVTLNVANGTYSLWLHVMDTNDLFLSFCGTHSAMTYTILHAHVTGSLEKNPLVRCFLDDFCRGFNKMFEAYQAIEPYNFATAQEMIAKFNDLIITDFFLPDYLFFLCRDKYQMEDILVLEDQATPYYMVAQKDYIVDCPFDQAPQVPIAKTNLKMLKDHFSFYAQAFKRSQKNSNLSSNSNGEQESLKCDEIYSQIWSKVDVEKHFDRSLTKYHTASVAYQDVISQLCEMIEKMIFDKNSMSESDDSIHSYKTYLFAYFLHLQLIISHVDDEVFELADNPEVDTWIAAFESTKNEKNAQGQNFSVMTDIYAANGVQLRF